MDLLEYHNECARSVSDCFADDQQRRGYPELGALEEMFRKKAACSGSAQIPQELDLFEMKCRTQSMQHEPSFVNNSAVVVTLVDGIEQNGALHKKLFDQWDQVLSEKRSLSSNSSIASSTRSGDSTQTTTVPWEALCAGQKAPFTIPTVDHRFHIESPISYSDDVSHQTSAEILNSAAKFANEVQSQQMKYESQYQKLIAIKEEEEVPFATKSDTPMLKPNNLAKRDILVMPPTHHKQIRSDISQLKHGRPLANKNPTIPYCRQPDSLQSHRYENQSWLNIQVPIIDLDDVLGVEIPLEAELDWGIRQLPTEDQRFQIISGKENISGLANQQNQLDPLKAQNQNQSLTAQQDHVGKNDKIKQKNIVSHQMLQEKLLPRFQVPPPRKICPSKVSGKLFLNQSIKPEPKLLPESFGLSEGQERIRSESIGSKSGEFQDLGCPNQSGFQNFDLSRRSIAKMKKYGILPSEQQDSKATGQKLEPKQVSKSSEHLLKATNLASLPTATSTTRECSCLRLAAQSSETTAVAPRPKPPSRRRGNGWSKRAKEYRAPRPSLTARNSCNCGKVLPNNHVNLESSSKSQSSSRCLRNLKVFPNSFQDPAEFKLGDCVGCGVKRVLVFSFGERSAQGGVETEMEEEEDEEYTPRDPPLGKRKPACGSGPEQPAARRKVADKLLSVQRPQSSTRSGASLSGHDPLIAKLSRISPMCCSCFLGLLGKEQFAALMTQGKDLVLKNPTAFEFAQSIECYYATVMLPLANYEDFSRDYYGRVIYNIGTRLLYKFKNLHQLFSAQNSSALPPSEHESSLCNRFLLQIAFNIQKIRVLLDIKHTRGADRLAALNNEERQIVQDEVETLVRIDTVFGFGGY